MSPGIQTPIRPAVDEAPSPSTERGEGRRRRTRRARRGSPLRRLHLLLVSRRTAVMLILGMGLLSLLGTLIDQVPDEVRSDPQTYAAWVEAVRPKYGGWTTPLQVAGMFDIFSSVWFTGVTVLLGASILACSARRAPQLWRRARHPRLRQPDTFFDRAHYRATVVMAVPPEDAATRVRTALEDRGFRTSMHQQGAEVSVYADRFRYMPLGTVVAHLSIVVILLGVLVSATTGFKDSEFAVPVGSRVDVGHGTGLSVEATAFADAYYANGSPKDYASELVLYDGGTPVAEQTVRVNHPLRWEGTSFYQAYFGPAADIRVDSRGRTLYDAGVPLEWTSDDGRHSIGRIDLPEQGLVVYVVGAASGRTDPVIAAGQLQLEVYRQGNPRPVAIEVVSQGEPATVAGLELTFLRERQFTGLIVSRDPGAVWVWIGSGLMVLGLFLVLFFRHRRVWARVRPTPLGSELRLASSDRPDSAFETWFRALVADLGEPASDPSTRPEKVGASDA